MSRRFKADLALAFCSLIWGATFVVVKEALAHASVFVFLAARFALASALMAFIYQTALRRLTRADLWAGSQIGFFMFTGYAFQTAGLQFTTPSKAAFITGFGVVLVPVLLALWGHRVKALVWLGALAAVVGLYYLTVPSGSLGRRELNVGDLLVLACAVMFALHIILVGRYSPRHSVGALSFLQVSVTAVLTALSVPLFAATGLEVPHISATGELLFAIVITAVGATAVAFSVQVWAQQYTTPTHTAILFSLEPVFAALTSYVVIGERLSGRALFGGILILLGILLAELKGPAQAVSPETRNITRPGPHNRSTPEAGPE